jgi:hypothetical protein
VSPVELKNAQRKASVKRIWWTVRSLFECSSYPPADQPSVCAICVPPGARLILKDISPLMQRDLGLGPEEGGKFIETSIDVLRHRDAIQLTNGRVIPLQLLCEGQRIKVLSLVPVEELVEEAPEARQRADVLIAAAIFTLLVERTMQILLPWLAGYDVLTGVLQSSCLMVRKVCVCQSLFSSRPAWGAWIETAVTRQTLTRTLVAPRVQSSPPDH